MHLVTDLKHLIKKIMEEAAAELDNKFQETEKKLDNVSWKVEQLVKVETSAGSGSDSLSAAQLLSNVQEIRSDFNSLVQLVEQLIQEQQNNMTNFLQKQQNTMTNFLQKQQNNMTNFLQELETAMDSAEKLLKDT